MSMYPAALRWTIKNPLSLMACGFLYFFASWRILNWRRKRDSNPRYVAVYTLSRRAPSTARPSLLIFRSTELRKARKDNVVWALLQSLIRPRLPIHPSVGRLLPSRLRFFPFPRGFCRLPLGLACKSWPRWFAWWVGLVGFPRFQSS